MIKKTRDSQSVDIAIIGAGSAGLSAYKEATKHTNSVLLIDQGPLGTTCARIGCMPSKALIQAANYYYDRNKYLERGIKGANNLSISSEKLFKYIRKTRDEFTNGIIKEINGLGSKFLSGHARFINENQIDVNGTIINCKKFIVTIGRQPVIPKDWKIFEKKILTVNNFFEQETVADKIVTIGAGPVGLELSQALSRIGVDICVFHSEKFIGSLSDPSINQAALKILQSEFSIHTGYKAKVSTENNRLLVTNQNTKTDADSILVSIGMKPNFTALCLENTGATFDAKGYPIYDKRTLSIDNTAGFIAGDANNLKPILHEASDEGRIAGYNATHPDKKCYARRTPLTVIFTDPNIAVVGKSFKELDANRIIIGKIDFSDQGRSKLMSKNHGIMHIYATKEKGEILGAEMICPDGEHLAHLLALAIEMKLSVHDLLKMPFYHPTVEEGMRTALRQISEKVANSTDSQLEMLLCDSNAPVNLS